MQAKTNERHWYSTFDAIRYNWTDLIIALWIQFNGLPSSLRLIHNSLPTWCTVSIFFFFHPFCNFVAQRIQISYSPASSFERIIAQFYFLIFDEIIEDCSLVDIDSTNIIFGLRYDIALIFNIDLDHPYFTLKQIYIPL